MVDEDLEYLGLAAALKNGAEASAGAGLDALCGDKYHKCIDRDGHEELSDEEWEKECMRPCEKLAGVMGMAPSEVSEIMGKLCRNSIMVTFTSPVFEYLAGVSGLKNKDTPEFADLMSLVRPVASKSKSTNKEPDSASESESEPEAKLELADGVVLTDKDVPPYAGWAVYPLLSAVNHACKPNLDTEFLQGDSTLSVLAKRKILKGQELTICYLVVE